MCLAYKMAKRQHTTLKLEQKVEIIKLIESGQSVRSIASKFGVGKSTISDINQNKKKIIDYVASSDSGPGSRKTLKQSAHPEMEKAVYTWFVQERARGTPLSGDLICEKAKFFYRQLTEADDFKASSGWLQKFKERFGIRQLTISGEALSSNVDAVKPFQERLLAKINEMGLQPEQIYNADESGLFYRVLPKKTLAYSGEKSAPGRKVSKERLTFMPCANASGTHKLRLLVLGKANCPRAFKNSFIPVYYKGQRKGWMTKEIFREWFYKEFVPSVRQKLSELNLPQKALLILDNCPGHPEDLRSDDNQIEVMYMPPNCTPLIQPMDQHVIQAVKLYCRKKLLQTIVESETDIATTLKSTNVKTVVYSLDESWHRVSEALIRKSWEKLLPEQLELDEDDIPLAVLAARIRKANAETNAFETEDVNEIKELTEKIIPDIQLAREDIEEWITGTDEIEVLLTDEDIVDGLAEASYEHYESSSNSEEEDSTNIIKHNEAVSSFNKCIQWASENNVPTHQILLLRELRKRHLKAKCHPKNKKILRIIFQ